jgi:hypothetical protein
MLKWLLGSERFDLLSPLPPTECSGRLRDAVDGEWLRMNRGAPAIGRVRETSFRIRRRLPVMMHNSFQTYVSGRFIAEHGQTRLRCRLGMHPLIGIFMPLWFALVVAFGAGWLFVGLRQGATGVMLWAGLTIPAVMTVFGIGLVRFGRFLARDEGPFLLDFLRQTLDARSANGQEPAVIARRR